MCLLLSLHYQYACYNFFIEYMLSSTSDADRNFLTKGSCEKLTEPHWVSGTRLSHKTLASRVTWDCWEQPPGKAPSGTTYQGVPLG